MKKNLLLSAALLMGVFSGFSQNKLYTTNTGTISFDATAPSSLDDIKGVNKATIAVLEPTSGKLQMQLTVTAFEFKSKLMEDHFNENYMESEKYPKSTFKGSITNMSTVNLSKDGTYPVTVKGMLDMHGVSKEVQTNGTLKVKGESVTANAEFTVLMKDYNINIPGAVADKLTKTCKITINCVLTPKK